MRERKRRRIDQQALEPRTNDMVRRARYLAEVSGMLRRLFALLDAVGERGCHVSSICEVLAVNTEVIDPVLAKLVLAGRVERFAAAGQFGRGSVYRVGKQNEER